MFVILLSYFLLLCISLLLNHFLFTNQEVISKLRLIKAKLHTGSSDAFHFGFDRFKEAEGDAESIALKEEEKRKNNLALELAKWHRNPIWTDQPYELKVKLFFLIREVFFHLWYIVIFLPTKLFFTIYFMISHKAAFSLYYN